MKRSALILLLAPFLAIFPSCSSGTNILSSCSDDSRSHGSVISQQRQASEFTSIDASRGVQVIYTQAPEVAVVVEAPEDVIDMVITKIDGDELEVKVDNSIRSIDFTVVVRVSSPMVTEFDACAGAAIKSDAVDATSSSSSTVEVEATSGSYIHISSLKAGKVSVESTSGASATVTGLLTPVLEAESSSGATLKLVGNATTVDLEATSGSSIDASRLTFTSGRAEASSGATVRCDKARLSHSHTSSAGSIIGNN